MNKNLSVIIKKELKRVFTDKRIVFTAFILPALSIALIYSIMGVALGNMIEDREEYIPKAYVRNMPQKFENLISNEPYNDMVDIEKISDDKELENIKEKIKLGEIDILVVFEKNFEEKLKNYENKEKPSIKTFYNSSEDYSSDARFGLFNQLFSRYENMVIGERLGNIEYTSAFNIDIGSEINDLVDEKEATGKGLSFLMPMLISIFLFAGAMGIGMDSIAGEKERGTMATLLVTPLKRETIAFGKIISLSIISIISALSSFIGIIVSFPFSKAVLGGDKDMNLTNLKFGASDLGKLFIIMITLVGIYVGLICLLSIIAKTVKEAGTYITPVYMIVMASSFMNMFSNSDPEMWQFLIPIYGSVVAIKNILMFQLTWTHVLISASVSVVSTIFLIYLIKKMFNNEKVMFG
ncbi:ABC transporter permease [Clostridium sp. D2Q-11]|uniref:ABC transporter permease n=1 Tax=Anaeromonas frigoriresistens TaxID=2683708 RepID=A0A942V2B5_9FIRM|nr:ABC transporter permease [Anaeromonas frigoriresistens]MBS4538697.1 ABC transporter permease [Anaeromonas frigoriresistens]